MNKLPNSNSEVYLQIIDQFPNPIWRAGLDAKCNFFNKAWLDFTGRTMEQEVGDGWAEGVYKDDLDDCVKTYLEHFNKRAKFEMKYRLKYNDGTYHWILDSGSPFFDENGEFLGYIGSCYDINKEEEYKNLFRNMMSGFALHKIITNEAGKPVDYVFLDVNDAFEEIVGLKKEDILGKRVTEVLPGTENETADWIGKYGKVALNGDNIRFENYSSLIKKWFHVSAYAPSKGFFVTIFEDITNLKNTENELLKSKDELTQKVNELEKMNKIMIDREVKMVQLKERIAELEKKP